MFSQGTAIFKFNKVVIILPLSGALPTVSVNTPVAAVIVLLQNFQAILTVKEDKVVGIVTNTDIGRVFELPETT